MLSSRQVFGGPVWTVVGGFTSTLANAAFNEVRASYSVEPSADHLQPGGDRRLGAAGAWPSGDVRATQLSRRDLRVRLHRARSRGRPVHQRHLLVPVWPAPDEGRRHRRAGENDHRQPQRPQRRVDVPDRPRVRHQQSEQLPGSLVGRTLDSQLQQAGLGLWRFRAGLVERAR